METLAEINLVKRPKGRSEKFEILISTQDGVIFHSRSVSIRLEELDLANEFTQFLLKCIELKAYVNPNSMHNKNIKWSGTNQYDEAYCEHMAYAGKYEHLSGPIKKGGVYFCSVEGSNDKKLEQSTNKLMNRLRPRSITACKWLIIQSIELLKANIPDKS